MSIVLASSDQVITIKPRLPWQLLLSDLFAKHRRISLDVIRRLADNGLPHSMTGYSPAHAQHA